MHLLKRKKNEYNTLSLIFKNIFKKDKKDKKEIIYFYKIKYLTKPKRKLKFVFN